MKLSHRSSSVLVVLLAGLAPGSADAQTVSESKIAGPLPVQDVRKAPAPSEAAPPVFPDLAREDYPTTAPATPPRRMVPSAVTQSSPEERNRVYTAEPRGDGTIWARGTTWKARFDASGTRFIPFLDPCAPSFPVDFSLASIEVGGEILDFNAVAAPVVSGTRVSFDRGSVVERYDLSVESIEQSFVFESLPPNMPSGGDLVVRIAVGSDLLRSASGEGLQFENQHGKVSYGKATVFDAEGRACGAGPELRGDVIELRVPAAFLATATFPVVVDPVVLVRSIDTSGFNDYLPDVAYDVTTDRYLVVYEETVSATDHDVFVRLVAGNGDLSVMGYVDSTSDFWTVPRVANNNIADQFLVVGQASINGSSPWLIAGVFVSAAGVIGNQFDISLPDQSGDKVRPAVGGDPVTAGPTYYCVAWERIASSNDHDIHYNLVQSNGALLGGTRLVDNTGSTLDSFPVMSKCDGQAPYDTQRWNVAWQRQAPSGQDVRGAQIRWDGTLVTPSFPIDSATSDDREISVSSLHDGASGDRDWMVAFSRPIGGDYDVILKSLRAGSVLGQANLTGLEALAGSGTLLEVQGRPYVDCDGSKFVIAYSESVQGSTFDLDVYLASADIVGSTPALSSGHEVLPSTNGFEGDSRVTTTHSGGGGRCRAMVVWERFLGNFNDGNIYVALYDAPIFQSFCFPGTDTVVCPCGNAPAGPGRGCNNSANTGGGILGASGTPAIDTVVFQATSMKPSTACIFLQGNAVNMGGIAFGDGVRCAAGTLKRLYTKSASTGSASAPTGGDPSVRARSGALGDVIAIGSTRWYQVYYRDPAAFACAGSATYNATNGIIVDWP